MLEFGVRDYVYFAAAGTVVGSVDMSFDPTRRMAWGQFSPTMVPYIATGVTNRIETESNIVGGLGSFVTLGALGSYADGKATEKAATMVADAFTRQLRSGVAITFDLARRQRDVVGLGQVAPLRPFADDVRWLVNEQQVLHAKAGAAHVVGPFAPTHGAGVDFAVLRGTLRYRAECEADVVEWFEPVTRGVRPVLPPVRHAQSGTVSAGMPVRRTLAAPCPWYLITEPGSEEVVANVRVRADTSGYPAAGP